MTKSSGYLSRNFFNPPATISLELITKNIVKESIKKIQPNFSLRVADIELIVVASCNIFPISPTGSEPFSAKISNERVFKAESLI